MPSQRGGQPYAGVASLPGERTSVSVLVVAAHPDDEVLGCGATIAKWTSAGRRVSILILGEGVTSRDGQPEANQRSLKELHEASIVAARHLGCEAPVNLGFPDNRFDTVPLLEIVKAIESHIADIRPTQVLVQHGGDLNIDHRRTFDAALAATRPMPDSRVRSVWSFEVRSSTDWAFDSFSPRFSADVYVDVSDHLETKLTALNAYANEMRQWPHTRSMEAVRASAAARGASVGVAAAEAFNVVWEIA